MDSTFSKTPTAFKQLVLASAIGIFVRILLREMDMALLQACILLKYPKF
ncbi:hypothetical protein ACQJ8O_06635 [Helicobacter pylori]